MDNYPYLYSTWNDLFILGSQVLRHICIVEKTKPASKLFFGHHFKMLDPKALVNNWEQLLQPASSRAEVVINFN